MFGVHPPLIRPSLAPIFSSALARCLLAAGLSAGPLAGVSGCGGENRHDVYVEALRIEGRAERQQCRLGFDADSHTNVLSSGRAAGCLYELRRAKTMYAKAKTLGYTGRDIDDKIEDLAVKIKRLQTMVEIVSGIERDQLRP